MKHNANIFLVHGAWADGSCWSKVLLLLKAKGYNVTAAQIPLTSLADDIAVTQRLLSAQNGPTVLVGHSYGGAVVTGAANGMHQVKGLGYITAFGLDAGESLASLSKQGPPSAGSAAIEADDKGYLWINREKFHSAFAADVTDDEAYPFLVSRLHRRSDDPSACSGVHGQADGCNRSVGGFEPRGIHV